MADDTPTPEAPAERPPTPAKTAKRKPPPPRKPVADTTKGGGPSPDPPEGDKGDGLEFGKTLIALIVAASSAVAVGVTGLGTTGTLGRAQRNHPELFSTSL